MTRRPSPTLTALEASAIGLGALAVIRLVLWFLGES